MLITSDRDGRMIAHGNAAHHFPLAGMPVEVPDHLGAHLLGLGGFQAAGPPQLQTGAGRMWLQKEQGGCEITHRGVVHAWPEDGSIAEVPDELAMDLVRLGGYQVVPPPEPDSDGDEDQGDGQGEGGPEDSGEGGEVGQQGTGQDDAPPEQPPAKPARPRSRKPTA